MSLARHRARTALAILGVAVAAAMLLDMVMLSSGMRESFGTLLESRGFSIRLAPRGTLPFDTEATIAAASEIVDEVSRHPDVTTVSSVLGATIHVVSGAQRATAFALGVNPAVQGDYQLEQGSDAGGGDSFVATERIESRLGFLPAYSNQEALIRNYDWYVANRDKIRDTAGVSHRAPWKQGILLIAKQFF